MRTLMLGTRRRVLLAFSVLAIGLVLPHASAVAQGKFVITPLAEKKVTELSAGALFWQVENFATLEAAEAAAGPMALAAEAEGKVWLFTLGAEGAPSNGGTMVVEIGPVPRVEATEYLLRINSGFGPPGAKTSVHTHPGSEAFLVLSGQLTQRTPKDVHVLDAGQTMPGVPDMPMEVSSSGSTDLHELIMFVVDANRPFSSPATLAALEPTLFVAELTEAATALDGASPGHDVAVIESFGGAERSYAVLSAADEPAVRAYLAQHGIEPTKVSRVDFVNSPVLGGGPNAGATPRPGHQVYVIERPIPGVGSFPLETKKAISMGSNAAVEKLGTIVEWDHSYLTSERTFCVYRAVDEATIREHSELAGAPIAMVTPVTHTMTAEAD